MRIIGSINKYRHEHGDITLKEIAVMLWPDEKPESARLRLSRITSGKATYIEIDFILRFCKLCNVSLNYLFEIDS